MGCGRRVNFAPRMVSNSGVKGSSLRVKDSARSGAAASHSARVELVKAGPRAAGDVTCQQPAHQNAPRNGRNVRPVASVRGQRPNPIHPLTRRSLATHQNPHRTDIAAERLQQPGDGVDEGQHRAARSASGRSAPRGRSGPDRDASAAIRAPPGNARRWPGSDRASAAGRARRWGLRAW